MEASHRNVKPTRGCWNGNRIKQWIAAKWKERALAIFDIPLREIVFWVMDWCATRDTIVLP